MNISRTLGATVVASAFLTHCALAKPRTPKVGSPERAAIMNATRPSLGNGRRKPIITAQHLKVENGWAFMSASWQYADGTSPGEDYENGPGTNFAALLHREGRRWRMKRFIYAGDVQGPEFRRAFPRAPRAIFGNY